PRCTRIPWPPEPSRVMLRDTPTLRGRWLEEQRRNRDRLADALRPWFAADSRPLVRHLVAGAALLAVEEVMASWAGDPTDPDVLGLLDEAFDLLESPLFDAATGWDLPVAPTAAP